ncbi:MAG TPA: Ig-like domain-containing protein [Vicinamibacterales bacterium]
MRYSFWKTVVPLLVIAACSSDSTGPSGGVPTLNSISVSLAASSLDVGQTTHALATLKDSAGQAITLSRGVSWASSNPDIASISSAGTVTALAAGNTVISASLDGKKGTADLSVTAQGQNPVTIKSVGVTLAAPTLIIGRTTQATAIPKDSAGNALTGRQVAWSTSDGNIAAVSSAGVVTGLGVGTAAISATSEGMAGTASVTVLPPSLVASLSLTLNASTIEVGGVAQGTVTAKDSSGDAVTGLPTTWATSDGKIASVSPTGSVTGVALGTATISATVDGKTATAPITVAPPAVATVTIVLNPDLIVGDTTTAQTILRDADQTTLKNREVAWTVENPTIASVSPTTGLVTALAEGNVIVTATSEHKSGNALLHVHPQSGGGGGGGGAAVATTLSVTTQPSSSATSGTAFTAQPVIQLRDASNNAVAQAGVTVTASIASGTGTLGGTATASTSTSGAATFSNLSITGSGNYTLRFAASGVTSITSSTIAIAPVVATKLLIKTQPSTSVAAGAVFPQQPVIQLVDASNNPISQSGVVVTAAIASGGGTLGGTKTATTNASGVATFAGLSIGGTIGNRTLRFTATSLTSVTSGNISVIAGVANKLMMATQPSTTAESGVAFAVQPAVRLTDAWGNPVSQSGLTVTASVATGSGSLGGTVNATTNSSGVVTFSDLKITGSGVFTLRFVALGIAAATCGDITVNGAPAGAATLAIVTQPAISATSGVALSPQPAIQLQDVSGQAVNQSGVAVTASIATGSGTLGGTTTASTNSSGVATFTNLSISGTDGAQTLRFSSGALTAVTSTAINLTTVLSGGSGGTATIVEDFSGYSSTADLMLDPKGIYQKVEDINIGRIALDASVGYGSSGKSMRYDYPDRSGTGGSGTSGRCTDYTISRSLKFPTGIQEVWVEMMVKTSTNFTTQAPSSWGCTSDQGLKFLDGNVYPGDRFSIGLRTGLSAPSSGQLWFGYPNNVTDPQGKVDFGASANATDGAWHQYRCHWKISSGYPSSAQADGRITCWVDGRMVVDEQNIRTTSTAGSQPPEGFYGLALGRNINQGPDHAQSIWWGQVKIYKTNPGW